MGCFSLFENVANCLWSRHRATCPSYLDVMVQLKAFLVIFNKRSICGILAKTRKPSPAKFTIWDNNKEKTDINDSRASWDWEIKHRHESIRRNDYCLDMGDLHSCNCKSRFNRDIKLGIPAKKKRPVQAVLLYILFNKCYICFIFNLLLIYGIPSWIIRYSNIK